MITENKILTFAHVKCDSDFTEAKVIIIKVNQETREVLDKEGNVIGYAFGPRADLKLHLSVCR